MMYSRNVILLGTITTVCTLYMLYKNIDNVKSYVIDTVVPPLEEEKVIDLDELEEKVVKDETENIVKVIENEEEQFNFDYSCCEPISTSVELLEILNCNNKIYNFYELIWAINNYLYEHDLLELQFVTLNDSIKKLLDEDNTETLPYHIFIEKILDNHVHKYI